MYYIMCTAVTRQGYRMHGVCYENVVMCVYVGDVCACGVEENVTSTAVVSGVRVCTAAE